MRIEGTRYQKPDQGEAAPAPMTPNANQTDMESPGRGSDRDGLAGDVAVRSRCTHPYAAGRLQLPPGPQSELLTLFVSQLIPRSFLGLSGSKRRFRYRRVMGSVRHESESEPEYEYMCAEGYSAARSRTRSRLCSWCPSDCACGAPELPCSSRQVAVLPTCIGRPLSMHGA